MRYIYLILYFVASCTASENKLIVVFKDGTDIIAGNQVVLKEQKVGTIKEVNLNSNYDVCATIILNDDLKLPVDSEFRLISVSLFDSGIEVLPGSEKKHLKSNDSVVGKIPLQTQLEDVLDGITKAIDNSKPVRNQDSLITEIHKLNEEVEKLNKK